MKNIKNIEKKTLVINLKMKKLFLTFLFLFGCNYVSAQLKTNASSIFKMHIYLDRKLSFSTQLDKSIIKNDSLYKAFSDAINIELDTLKVAGDYYFTKSALAPIYSFFRYKSHSWNRKLSTHESWLLDLYGENVEYVIAINQLNGKNYRISGFDDNDFLGFLSDFNEELKKGHGGKFSSKYFLRNFKVDGLDFRCLYKGLRSNHIDRTKYPCLKRVKDPIEIH